MVGSDRTLDGRRVTGVEFRHDEAQEDQSRFGSRGRPGLRGRRVASTSRSPAAFAPSAYLFALRGACGAARVGR